LSQKRYNVTGIEISKEAIDLIQQNYSCENLQLVHGDIFNMPFDSNSYDVVLSLGVLEHFEKREILDKAIREHVRVLRNDGIFIVTVPYLSLLRLLIHMPYTKILTCVRRLKFKEQFFTEYRYSYNEFKRILEANGLLIMETIWDDLLSPFSFGMTVDYPLKRITAAKEIEQYKMNKNAARVYRVIWKVNPGLVSGGIGFICRKIS
jgi:SAM-dependent methyltransferase